ncbi:MAG: radical SAM protein [Desulfurivibrionaceae bacterium]|jgi:uncharacterized protein|nr:radical SAM protein [Pseudomonadota bacterium]MBU4229825.1 radical SAM protein [Pseudomonadota bacterium]MCG2822146.1 radical SAM protein [Desulfobulbaceae bacterium]MDP2003754.1 radical SAM protein [Desulfurivibrionaceae bacterium]PKN21419.1 MAG: hypothetical protein CVU68_07670 [Deltaproteobacteria bacterium HGW-Deltaproteobacteria-3]
MEHAYGVINQIVRRNRGNDEIEFNLTFLVTEDCNLRCIYCFEPNKRPKKMSFDVARQAIDTYLDREDGPPTVSIDFCGGEPLLEFDLIKNVFEYCHSRTWKKRYRMSLGTNGTVLTETMKEWFLRHPCFQLSLSLDGTKEVHDHNRSNSYDRVIRHVDFFRRYDQTVKMTISPFTIPRLADSIVHIHELGLKPEANVVFENIWGTPEEKSQLLRVYARELDKLVAFYVAHPELPAPKLVGHRIETLCAEQEYGLEEKYCGAGKYMTAIMPDGKEYPCHRFSPLGSSAPTQHIEFDKQIKGPSQCIQCGVRRLCHSCLGANHEICNSVDIRTVAHCEFVKLEILASAKLAARRLEPFLQNFKLEGEIDEDTALRVAYVKNFVRSINWVQDNVHLQESVCA